MTAAKQTAVTVSGDVNKLSFLLKHARTQAGLKERLPGTMRADRYTGQALTLVQSNPGLLRCLPASIITGIYQAAELGLELNGVLGQAYLVPRYSKSHGCKVASFQVGYRGFPVLAFRSGKVRCFRPETVFLNDPFEIVLGTSPMIRHKPGTGDRGPAVGYYAICQYDNMGCDFSWFTADEMKAHRLRYAEATSPAWQSSYEKMAHKTMMRQLGTRLPLAIQLQEASITDDYHEQGIFQEPKIPVDLQDADPDYLALMEGGGDPGDGTQEADPPGDEEFQGGPEPD